jgi:hypothetical protein
MSIGLRKTKHIGTKQHQTLLATKKRASEYTIIFFESHPDRTLSTTFSLSTPYT